MLFGDMWKRHRQRLKAHPIDWAERFGVTPSYVYQIERGATIPTEDFIARACAALEQPEMARYFQSLAAFDRAMRKFPPMSEESSEALRLLLIRVAKGHDTPEFWRRVEAALGETG